MILIDLLFINLMGFVLLTFKKKIPSQCEAYAIGSKTFEGSNSFSVIRNLIADLKEPIVFFCFCNYQMKEKILTE